MKSMISSATLRGYSRHIYSSALSLGPDIQLRIHLPADAQVLLQAFTIPERGCGLVPRRTRNLTILIARRLSVASLVSVVVAVFVAGCGASRGDSYPRRSVSEAQTVAYAHAVNLRPADVRGFVGSTAALRRKTRYGPYGTLGERCAGGVTQPGDVFGVLSPTFRRRHGLESGSLPIDESVFSAVYLLRSDAMASHEVSVFASARARSCLKRDNYDQVSTTGTKSDPLFTDVKIAPLSLLAGSVVAHGHRGTAVEAAFLEAPHMRGRRNYYEDFVGFSVGPAVITLHATGSTHPFSAATEQRLLSLLYRRAEESSSILSK
jgi:hypothetical protein